MRFIVLSFLLGIFAFGWATEPNYYNLGNQFYKDAKYDSAAFCYEKALEVVGHNPDIYFNLGNAYFKMRKLGKAIVNYYRALFLSPRSKEIKYNLAFAKSFLRDDIKSVRTGFVYGIYSSIVNFFSFKELLLIILIMSAVLTIFGILWLVIGRAIFRRGFIFACVVLVVFVLIFVLKRGDPWEYNLAVVVVPEFQVRSGPSESNELLFTIHEGTSVVLTERRENWVRIQLEDGKEGWGRADGIEKVIVD